jgi:hypothetical protein
MSIRHIAMAGFFAALIFSTPSSAQTPAPVQQSFVSLTGAGFKVAGTFLVPGADTTAKAAMVVVTLQKDSAVAVCTFSLGAWENLSNNVAATDAKTCDVRTP